MLQLILLCFAAACATKSSYYCRRQ